MMTLRRTLILFSLAAVLPVTPAAAQSGVIIDDSPADKEYAVPLESARQDAAGTSGGGSSSSPAPLFGAGVGDSEEGSGSRPKSSKHGKQQASHHAAGQPSGAVGGGRAAATTATVPDGGIGSTLTIAAVALSVLLLGGVIGSIARRRAS